MLMEAADEPGSGGYRAVCTQPQFRVEREKSVTRSQIFAEGGIRVITGSIPLKDDAVALEESVRFMAG